jgi:hypothetical protein
VDGAKSRLRRPEHRRLLHKLHRCRADRQFFRRRAPHRALRHSHFRAAARSAAGITGRMATQTGLPWTAMFWLCFLLSSGRPSPAWARLGSRVSVTGVARSGVNVLTVVNAQSLTANGQTVNVGAAAGAPPQPPAAPPAPCAAVVGRRLPRLSPEHRQLRRNSETANASGQLPNSNRSPARSDRSKLRRFGCGTGSFYEYSAQRAAASVA